MKKQEAKWRCSGVLFISKVVFYEKQVQLEEEEEIHGECYRNSKGASLTSSVCLEMW